MPQVCRAVACLLVAALHGGDLVTERYGVQPLFGLTAFGFSGVHLFFVISGLIIYHAHRRELGDVRNARRYLLKRVVRIYPFYWIVFFLLGGRKVFLHRLEISDFFSNALLFTSSKSLVLAVSWTLAYEMIFYGIFVAFFFRKKLGVAVFALWFAMVALNHRYAFSAWIALDAINLLFMMGLLTSIALSALRRTASPLRRARIGVASAIAGALLFAATGWYYLVLVDRSTYLWDDLVMIAGFGTGGALLLLASVSAGIEGFLKRRTLLLLIGDASYSIYLVHSYFQKRAANAIGSLAWVESGEKTQIAALLFFAVLLAVAVVAGIGIHKVVEKPLLTWCRRALRIGGSARATAQAAAQPGQLPGQASGSPS